MIEDVYYNTGTVGVITSSSTVYALEVKKQTSENTMVGVMYASDFGYAISDYTGYLGYTSPYSQMVNNWLFSNGYEWTMIADKPTSHPVIVSNSGELSQTAAYIGCAVRPVLYLQSNVNKLSGDGTMASPYVLGM